MPLLYLLGLAGAIFVGVSVLGGRAQAQAASYRPPLPPPLPPTEGRRREHEAEDDSSAGDDDPGWPGPPGPRGMPPPVPPPLTATPPSMSDWARTLAPLCLAAGIPTAFAVKWIAMESGGNPCAVGYPPDHGPDGLPRELGIAQLYNPDDLDVVDPSLTGTELRACCVPGDQHETRYKGKVVRGFSGNMARPITEHEVSRQAAGAVGLIARSARAATKALTAVHAGPAWSVTTRDYWAMVKLRHALPVVVTTGLPGVVDKLGRPPQSWAEFARVCLTVRFRPEVAAKVPGALSNAERCASVLPDRMVS